jgi:hypothetical protein
MNSKKSLFFISLLFVGSGLYGKSLESKVQKLKIELESYSNSKGLKISVKKISLHKKTTERELGKLENEVKGETK